MEFDQTLFRSMPMHLLSVRFSKENAWSSLVQLEETKSVHIINMNSGE